MIPNARTEAVLADVQPALAYKVRQVLDAMTILGFPMVAYSGRRTVAQQQALYAKGRTTPGPAVTNCDGVVKCSRHQAGAAVDCAFVVSGGTPNNWTVKWDGPWEAFGACAEAVGLRWGGRWKGRLVDRPHVEMQED